MALAAAAVAATTMRCSGISEFVLHGRIRPEALFGHFFETGQTHMQAAGVMLGDILMALPAGRRSIRVRGIFYHALMGGFPIRIIWVAAMARVAAELTMKFVLCDFTVNVNFFVRSQRLHIATSAFTCYF
jgi:hypothetical protein